MKCDCYKKVLKLIKELEKVIEQSYKDLPSESEWDKGYNSGRFMTLREVIKLIDSPKFILNKEERDITKMQFSRTLFKIHLIKLMEKLEAGQ